MIEAILLALAILSGDVTTYEDGSAVIDYGSVRIVIDAMDSPGDTIHVVLD